MSSSSSETQPNDFSSSDSTAIHTPISTSSSSESLSRARPRSRSPATGAIGTGGSRTDGSVRRRRSPPPQISTTDSHKVKSNGHLTAPESAWRTLSRSPSPLGLIPIHRTFSSLVRTPLEFIRSAFMRFLVPRAVSGFSFLSFWSWWNGSHGSTSFSSSSIGGEEGNSSSSSSGHQAAPAPSPTLSTFRSRSLSSSSHSSSSSSSSPRKRKKKKPFERFLTSVLSQIHRHEVPRKLLHVSIGGLVLFLYRNGFQPSSITPILLSLLIPIASADILRFSVPSFNAFYIRCLGALMRESEVKGWNGVIWYILGTLVVLHFAPKDVAVVSVLLLSWCDTAASTFGRAWGRYTPAVRKGKSLAGCIASFLVGVFTAGLFWGSFAPNTPAFPNDPVGAMGEMWTGALELPGVGIVKGGAALAVMSLWTGFAGMFSEVLDVFGADDNVVIPIVSAMGIYGFLKAFAV